MSDPVEDSTLDQAAVRALFGSGFASVEALAGLLQQEGVRRGLIGPREVGRLWSRHLVNCAVLEPYLPPAGQVLDIGSGAGLPGLVLAAMRPSLSFELVDSMRRRTEWLQEAVACLGLANTTVTWSRVEDLPAGHHYDAVVSRAVGTLTKLALWGAPLLVPGGVFLALKGRTAREELLSFLASPGQADLVDLTVEAVRVLPEVDTTYVVRGFKAGPDAGAVAHN